MRILHVVSSYLPATRYGGTIVSVHGLCRALSARGHDVHVYTTSVDGSRDSAVPHDVAVDLDGVKVWYFASRLVRRLYWAPPLAAALAANIRSFDIVHTHAIFLWPLWAAARNARQSAVPYVVSPRGMLEKDLIERKNRILKSIWIAAIERRNLEHATAIHVTSAREAAQASAFGFDLPRFIQIPNGVDLDRATGAVSPAVADIVNGPPFVLFVGRINWKKGLDRLVEALRHAPGVRLVIAGNDEEGYQRVLVALANRIGVADRLIFSGRVASADKQALLEGARALVLPSYSENFGNVVLEAMAAGRAVIVTPEVGLADLVHETEAGQVVSGDPITLGGALAEIMRSPDRARQMGERGRCVAHDRFSWSSVAERMETAYRACLAPERSSP